MAGNVHKNEVSKVKIPSPFLEEDRGLKRCGSPTLVLASLSDNSRYKNDITRVAVVCDSLTVELEKENGDVIAAPGLAVDFPFQSNAKGFMIDWRQLTFTSSQTGTILDAGCYKVKVTFEIAGVEGSFYHSAYRLKPWTFQSAKGTVQVFTVLNDVVLDDEINYRESGFAGSIRFKGSFGYMQPNYETTNLTYTDRTRKKVRIEARRSYELRTSFVTNCYTTELDEEHLLSANQIWITEHNPFAHKQYRQFPVIISKDESPTFEYSEGVLAKVVAFFKDKVATHESKYDGDIEAKINASFDLPQGVNASGCANVEIELNEEPTYSVPSGDTQNINLLDQNGDDVNVISTSGDNVTTDANLWWRRNPDWLTMPTLSTGDNRTVALFAVFEDGFNTPVLRLNNGSHFINWGDGNTSNGSGYNQLYQHTYTYSSLTGIVLTSDDGRNYKQVLIIVDYDDANTVIGFNLNSTPTFGNNPRTQGFLDVICCKDVGSANDMIVVFSDSPFIHAYIERVEIIGNTSCRLFNKMSSLKVLKYDFTGREFGLSELKEVGDVRADENGTPITIDSPNLVGTNVQQTLFLSNVSKIGNLNFPGATNNSNFFRGSVNLQEVGSLGFEDGVIVTGIISECYNVKKIGVVTVGINCDSTTIFAENAYRLAKLIFSGDMSGVTSTLRMVNNCYNLRELILPNITIGFDISDSQITGQPLQDLGNSLGTANGTQTITLPNFVNGQDVSVFTSKGYTIAYA